MMKTSHGPSFDRLHAESFAEDETDIKRDNYNRWVAKQEEKGNKYFSNVTPYIHFLYYSRYFTIGSYIHVSRANIILRELKDKHYDA